MGEDFSISFLVVVALALYNLFFLTTFKHLQFSLDSL